ncbi:hypothetical protein ACHAWC_004886, partial [Mediolabrus comicus]
DDGDNEPVIDGGADGGVDGVGVDGEGADKANDNENNKEAAAATTTAAENDNTPSSSSNKGARRMAAMRRRRYQAKKKEEENDIDATAVAEGAGEEKKGADEEKIDDDNKTAEEEPTLIQDALEEKETNEKDNEENDEEEEEEEEATGEGGETKKKYMGVARMRRKIIKEQKAQRIAELEAAVSSESGGDGGGSDAIDAAATMAAMGMTASMIRTGSSAAEGDLSDVAIKTLQKKKKKSWWKLIFPPMSLVPRLVTLTLLFMAGLDVGLEPHRMMTTNTSSSSMLSETDNNDAASGVHLIYHVESSLTKPWEYGMGGKARHMMGMMETAPPTSLPTSFTRKEEFCIDSGKECDAKEGVSTSKEKEMEMKEKLLSGDDDEEEDNSLLPKGVSASEFDDDEDDIRDGKDTFSPPVIDPIFRVDLDDLLQNSQLPAPINFCAKFAIGFHRMWVRYLWTIPTSVVTSVLYSPKTLIDSWMANPPIFLFISLLIRMIVRLLLGNASSLSDEEDEDGGGSGGKKKDNLDVLGKIKDTALNYATTSFPKTILVLKTLKEVVTVDMYVILCGLLVGLVAPLVKEDLGIGKSGGGHVLGDGEL